jgi:hypothetical protein
MAATKQTAKGKRTTGKAKEIAGAVNRAKPGQKNQPPKRDNSKDRTTKEGTQPGEARELENVTSLEEIAEPIESTTTAGASQQGATESTGESATDRAEGETAEAQTTNQATEPAPQIEQTQTVEQEQATATEQASKGTAGAGHKQTKIAKIERTGAAVTLQQGDETKTGSICDLVHPKKKAMLLSIEKTGGSILAAADACKISTASHYQWVKEDPLYAELFQEYYNRSTQTLITEAIRRATEGQQEPILYQGKQVIGPDGKPLFKTFKSDNLIMFLLKQRDPTFRDNYIHNVGIWGKAGQVNLVFNIPRPAGESITAGVDEAGKKHHSDNVHYVNKNDGDIIDVEPEPEQGDQVASRGKG